MSMGEDEALRLLHQKKRGMGMRRSGRHTTTKETTCFVMKVCVAAAVSQILRTEKNGVGLEPGTKSPVAVSWLEIYNFFPFPKSDFRHPLFYSSDYPSLFSNGAWEGDLLHLSKMMMQFPE